MGLKQVSPLKQGQGITFFTVPSAVLASYIAVQCVFEESDQPAKRTTWCDAQFMASPGWSSALVTSWETVWRVNVVSPGLPNSQHIDTNPEQSVRYPSYVFSWLYGTCLFTQSCPREIIVDLATHCRLSASGFTLSDTYTIALVASRVTSTMAMTSLLMDMLEDLQQQFNMQNWSYRHNYGTTNLGENKINLQKSIKKILRVQYHYPYSKRINLDQIRKNGKKP